jgi:signal transduction histidine kinase
MLIGIVFLILALTVSALVALDVGKIPNDLSLVPAEWQAQPIDRVTGGAPRDAATHAFPPEPAGTAMPAMPHDISRPGGVTSPAAGHRRTDAAPAAQQQNGVKRSQVRSRLVLLAIIPALAAVAGTLSVVRMVTSLRGTSYHSQVSSVRDGAIVDALVAGVVLVVVVVLALWLTIRVARSVLRPLHKLRTGALDAADVRLPRAVHDLSESEGDRVPPEGTPIKVGTSDEIADVAHAFDLVYSEALRLATSEAAIRGKLNTIFVNLSRRSQALVERQIRLIDELEQGEQQPERRANLSKLDHLVTRMRRYSQNLLILAGHEPSGYSSQPIALVNVIRAAVSEVEEYERVSLKVQPGIAVSAPAVNDVVHMLAELIENATSLSAADTPVLISGRILASGGFLIDVTDRGFGMSAEEMAHANWRLDNPPATDVTVLKSMGLSVVGRLAARHGVRIRLRQADSGGLTALVWLPNAVLLQQEAPVAPGFSSFGGARSRPDMVEPARHGRVVQLDSDRAPVE